MTLKIAQRCNTPDGPGVIMAKERYGNGDMDYRLGIKHDVYPVTRPPRLYRDDILYYLPHEVSEGEVLAVA
jgi:hypothetical protein